MSEANKEQIPRIGHTEGIPFEQKVIHQRWHIPEIGFYWLIAEIDPEDDLAFGYANLNDGLNAEWGYISLAELAKTGAKIDEEWTSTKFAKVKEEKQCLNS